MHSVAPGSPLVLRDCRTLSVHEASSSREVRSLQDFLSGEAGLDGADIGSDSFGADGSRQGEDRAEVDLDEQEFWRETRRILQIQNQNGAATAVSDSEGSSFYGDYSDDDSVGGESPLANGNL